ncbi:hypothetical protein MP228_004583 [Amoeboaphelidium protococcarum]|nr:hypothetical protein MP228_004583 [Amoeboaphelidium protococcarum]
MKKKNGSVPELLVIAEMFESKDTYINQSTRIAREAGYTTFLSLVIILSGSVARLRVLTVYKLSNSDAAAQDTLNQCQSYQIKVNANQNNVNTIQANVNTIREDVDDLKSSQNGLLVAFKKECNASRVDGSVRQYDEIP